LDLAERIKMNWETIGVIAEIIGATAVVITLVFLTREMRLNRVAAESGSVDSLSTGWNDLNTTVMSDTELCEIWIQGFKDPTALTEVQRLRFLLIGQSYLNHLTTIKKHFDSGTLLSKDWDIHKAGTCQIMNSPGGLWLTKNLAVPPDVIQLIVEYSANNDVSAYQWSASA
jgi:hypothetical protein